MSYNNPNTSKMNYGINKLNNSITQLKYIVNHLAIKISNIETSVGILGNALIDNNLLDSTALNAYYKINDSEPVTIEAPTPTTTETVKKTSEPVTIDTPTPTETVKKTSEPVTIDTPTPTETVKKTSENNLRMIIEKE